MLDVVVRAPDAERGLVRVSREAAESFLTFCLEWEEPPYSVIELAWDLRRSFGNEGFPMWRALMLRYDYQGATVPHAFKNYVREYTSQDYEIYVADAWAKIPNTPTPGQFDRLLIDAFEEARAAGWVPPADADALLESLYDEPYAEHEAKRRIGMVNIQRWAGDIAARIRAEDESANRGMSDFVRDPRTMKPESDNPDNIEFLIDLIECKVRWNGWLERVEIRGCPRYEADMQWPEWTPVNDTIVAKLRMRCMRTKTRFCPSKEFTWDALIALAHKNPEDPAVEHIDELEFLWDGTPRLHYWLSETCGVRSDPYHAAVGRNIIGGMVKRIRHPGAKQDETTVMIGGQGTGKSTVAAILADMGQSSLAELKHGRGQWFSDSVKLGDEAKELVLSLAGKAVVEIAEMSTRTADVNAIKAMISRQTDAGRTAYARSVTERPRRNIFMCSTNDSQPLSDPTGGRRFLPIRVGREINLGWLHSHIRQLIGEAATLESRGDNFAIPREVWSAAAEHQESARSRPEFSIHFAEWFAQSPNPTFITAADLSEFAKAAAGRSVHASRYVEEIKRLGFVDTSKRVNGKTVAVWYRGDLATAMRIIPRNENGRTVAVMVPSRPS